MAVKITSGGALTRMQNAITQANMAFKHNMEPDVREKWSLTISFMIDCRKRAIEKNENQEAVKNGKI